VVEDHGDKNAGQDRHRPVEASRQHQREKLRLVAKLGEGHEPERDKKGFHRYRWS
jgi:hypothetical protein